MSPEQLVRVRRRRNQRDAKQKMDCLPHSLNAYTAEHDWELTLKSITTMGSGRPARDSTWLISLRTTWTQSQKREGGPPPEAGPGVGNVSGSGSGSGSGTGRGRGGSGGACGGGGRFPWTGGESVEEVRSRALRPSTSAASAPEPASGLPGGPAAGGMRHAPPPFFPPLRPLLTGCCGR